jgi:hypothetical protein
MSTLRLVGFPLGLLLAVALVGSAHIPSPLRSMADSPDKKDSKDDKKARTSDRADANDINQEVTVLQVLHNLQANPAQLKALADLAATTAPKPGPRKVLPLTDRYYKALVGLRDALAAADDEKIIEHSGVLEELRDEEEPEFEDAEITDEARKAAPGLLRKFSSRQVALYLAGQADNFPDPGEQLADVLEKSRELKGKEWRTLRDDLAYQLGWLLAGVEEAAETKVRDQVTALLDKAQGLDAKAWNEQKADLEKAAREITAKVGPADVLRHYMERTLAEILSNPRLPAALALRMKKMK